VREEEGKKGTMSILIPKKLRRAPLVEVLWQAVFERPTSVPLGEVMVGLLYAEMRKLNPAWQVQRLPAAEIPPAVAEQDPLLRYAVKYRLEAPAEPVLYQVGDHIISVNCRRPYVGWAIFKEKILRVQELLAEKGGLPGPDHHGLRYLDLIRREDMADLEGLRLELQVGDQKIRTQPLQLRVELFYRNHTHVLQVIVPAQVHLPEGTEEGTLIDLETRAEAERDWEKVPQQIEAMHEACVAMFFEQILRPELIERFGPEY